MTYTQLIKHFGSHAIAARKLGYSVMTLYKWRNHGAIPIRAQAYIAYATADKLKADKQ
jgi:transposase-like protein